MDEHEHHEHLIAGISKEYQAILANAKQGIYIYLDDTHKLCNTTLAEMLGYDSPGEWAGIVDDPIGSMVAKGSQKALIDAYYNAREKATGSVVNIVWNKKGGGEVSTEIILVPIMFEGHFLALHFVTEK